MKDAPEIAPEIRGLLEEIVADPRSSMRLAPRRALRHWFDSGETIRPSEAARTKAERHLIEAHREALAQLLYEAAVIAYWKAPGLVFRASDDAGNLFDEGRAEAAWRPRAEGRRGTELLQGCLKGIHPGQAMALAQAALSLAPRDRTRLYLAYSLPLGSSRTAIALLDQVVDRRTRSLLHAEFLACLGSRLCAVGLLLEARGHYRSAVELCPDSPLDRFPSFNLSCLLGDESGALADADGLARISGADSRVSEATALLLEWNTSSGLNLCPARTVHLRIGDRLPEVAQNLCQAFEP